MGYGDSYVQNFSTCSKWQLTHSMCCQHTKEHHKLIFLHEKQTPHATTSPPIRQSHHHAHGVSICFKLLPHPPYFRTHCSNKTYHGKPVVDPLRCRHIKRERISKFGVCLGRRRNRMRVRLRWLWEWGWLLGVGGVGWWLFDRGNFLWSYLWGGMVEFDEHGGWKKMGMDSVGMKMD